LASLLLDTQTWDLCLDANINIAVCDEPYAYAQDAACHVRLFQGELRYDTSQGMPYEWSILGSWPAPSVLKAYMASQALLATGTVAAKPVITAWQRRVISGAILVTGEQSGTAASAAPFVLSSGATTI